MRSDITSPVKSKLTLLRSKFRLVGKRAGDSKRNPAMGRKHRTHNGVTMVLLESLPLMPLAHLIRVSTYTSPFPTYYTFPTYLLPKQKYLLF